jgi:hypothetical protein
MIMRRRYEDPTSMAFPYVTRTSARWLVVVLLSVAGLARPALAVPLPSPSPAPTVCGSAAPGLADGFDAVFSYEISSTAIQRFIALLGSASHEARSDVIKRASAAARSPEQAEIRGALAKVCQNASEFVGFARAVIVISHEWNDPDLDEKRADDLTGVLQNAVSALAHPDALTPDERVAAAAPFQALESDAPSSEGTVTKPCLVPFSGAKLVRFAPLTYPPIAQASHTSGIVVVKVTLSETGGVRSVRLFHETVGNDSGGQALVDAALVVAAASTYEPDREKCVSSPGAYLFKAVFNSR